MSRNEPRWSIDTMYPNGVIPQAVINFDMNLEQNRKSIRFYPKMYVFGSLSVPWSLAIGSIRLLLEHSFAISLLLL